MSVEAREKRVGKKCRNREEKRRIKMYGEILWSKRV